MEKEYIPRWTKFLQGYYDAAGISLDTFNQAITFSDTGNPRTSELLQFRNIVLQTNVDVTVFYLAFNMLDDVVGGYTEDRAFAYHRVNLGLYHEWLKNGKPNTTGYNTLKYKRIDSTLRTRQRK